MKLNLFAILFLIFPIGCGLRAQNLSIDNWTNYCGWHYLNNPPVWGAWVREPAKDQFGLFISDSITYEIDTLALKNSFNILSKFDTKIDFLNLDGGLGSARDTSRVIKFMNMIEADNGLKWKDIVYKQSKKLTELPLAENRVFWQIGNEISSPGYSRTIRYWQGQAYNAGYGFDSYVIPYYVENYLAPGVEAIDSASFDVYGQKGRIKICLGSISNGSNPAAQTFLASLLNYQVQGTNAPTLAGMKVYELVHLITIHYTLGTSSTDDWLANISAYKNWTGTGRIEGVWSTEEVGVNQATSGNGAFASAITTSRLIEWAIDNHYNAKSVRTNYFGWNTGNPVSTVNAFNTFLFNYLGDVQLSNVNSNATTINSDNSLEKHSFLTEQGNKGVLLVFPERIQNQVTSAIINQVVLSHSDWGTVQNVSAYIYNNTGINPVEISLSNGAGFTAITLNIPLLLNNTDGLLFYIDTQISTGNDDNGNTDHDNCDIFPNPAYDYIHLSGADNLNSIINIFDINGRLLKSYNNESMIYIGDLVRGIYLIKIRHNNSDVIQKFIKY